MNQEGLKQRLIELLRTATCEEVLTNSDGEVIDSHLIRMVNVDVVTLLADHLIAKGVTIRERGEWICKFISTFPQYEPDQYCCSNCGCIKNLEYSFCPNCGADMRGGKDE